MLVKSNIEVNQMKYEEFNEKKFAQGVSSISEEAMAMSNQVSDMMLDKCPANYKEMLTADCAGKAKYMNGAQIEESAITFKKDGEGNLIKVSGDGFESKKGNFPKDSSCSEFSLKGEPSLFKKDEYGNLIKVQRDGGQKSHFQTADMEIPLLYTHATKFKF